MKSRPLPPHGIRRPRTGFTLLELLVALSILSLTLTLLSGGIRFGTRVWERQAAAATGQAVQPADRWTALRHLLARIEVRRAPGRGHDRPLWFSGQPEQVMFIAAAPAAVTDAAVTDKVAQRRQWRLSQDADGYLRLDHRPWPPQDAADIVWRSENLGWGGRPGTLQLAYWGRPPLQADTDPGWQSVWQHRSTLPALIRLRLRMPALAPEDATQAFFEGIAALHLREEGAQ